MEDRPREERKSHLSGVLVFLRDALIFAMLVLCFVLADRIFPGTFRASADNAKTLSANAVQSDQTKIITILPDDETSLSGSASMESSTVTATPIWTETPAPTKTPEPSPTSDNAIANGDFSSVFPAYDTGKDAFLSDQSDSVRIAIDKIQKSGVTYYAADVWIRKIDAFQTAFADDTYGRGFHDMPLNIARDNHAVFAVSGDYYGAREQGVVMRDGVLYRDVMGDDVCILRRDGTLAVYQKGSFSTLDMLDQSVWQAWSFGPALVEDGIVCDTSDSRIKVANPRCAIGYYSPGHYCFIVADGRQNGYSEGMTLDELAHTFASMGCVTAYNLDGGATAMMVFRNKLVNHPVNGGRTSSDIIYF